MAEFKHIGISSVPSEKEEGDNNDGCSFLSDAESDELDGPLRFLKDQMGSGVRPEDVLKNILGPSLQIPPGADEVSLWEAVLELMFRPPARDPLPDVSTVDDVIRLIEQSSNIIVLTGAGISVSCGIPDFRSPNGLYARLAVEYPDLIEPQSMFDINFFELDPRPFFKFAKEIFPGKYSPSPCHKFIATLEQKGKLLRNYTQNIDTLEKSAGITRVVYCHGSFSTATCRQCKDQVLIKELKDSILKEEVPYCMKCTRLKEQLQQQKKKKKRSTNNSSSCSSNSARSIVLDDDDEVTVGVMKPDIVFFGEGLPDSFHKQLQEDKTKADLLIVMGSSLKVRPVSLIPDILPESVPRILINRERLQYIRGFDVRLLGYGDTIVKELCSRLGGDWAESVGGVTPTEVSCPEERIHLFNGAVWPKSDTDCGEKDVESNGSTPEEEEHSGSILVERGDTDDRVAPNTAFPRSNSSNEENTNSLKRSLRNSEPDINTLPTLSPKLFKPETSEQ